MLLDLSNFPPPYNLEVIGLSYTFTTNTGNQYLINFKDSTIDYQDTDIGDSIIYEFQFYRPICLNAAYDERVLSTILHALNSALADKRVVVYFICDADDEREVMRHKLFNLWYRRYGQLHFHKLDADIQYEDGVEYSSVLIHREHAHSQKLIGLFNELKQSFSEKQSGSTQ